MQSFSSITDWRNIRKIINLAQLKSNKQAKNKKFDQLSPLIRYRFAEDRDNK